MKITGAVLEEIGASRPFAETRPLTIAELELDPPGPAVTGPGSCGRCRAAACSAVGSPIRPAVGRTAQTAASAS